MSVDQELLGRAIEQAEIGLAEGGIPIGAVLARDGVVLGAEDLLRAHGVDVVNLDSPRLLRVDDLVHRRQPGALVRGHRRDRGLIFGRSVDRQLRLEPLGSNRADRMADLRSRLSRRCERLRVQPTEDARRADP